MLPHINIQTVLIVLCVWSVPDLEMSSETKLWCDHTWSPPKKQGRTRHWYAPRVTRVPRAVGEVYPGIVAGQSQGTDRPTTIHTHVHTDEQVSNQPTKQTNKTKNLQYIFRQICLYFCFVLWWLFHRHCFGILEEDWATAIQIPSTRNVKHWANHCCTMLQT